MTDWANNIPQHVKTRSLWSLCEIMQKQTSTSLDKSSLWPKLTPLTFSHCVSSFFSHRVNKWLQILHHTGSKQNTTVFTAQYIFIEHRNYVYRKNIHSLDWVGNTGSPHGMAAGETWRGKQTTALNVFSSTLHLMHDIKNSISDIIVASTNTDTRSQMFNRHRHWARLLLCKV